MIITISGRAGSGKTTVAKLLAKKLALQHLSSGGIFREMAREKNMSLLEFGRYADEHPGVDYRIEERMAGYAKTMDKVVLEGRLTGWLADKRGLFAFKVWLGAALPVRAKRIAVRDKKSCQAALEQIKQRDNSETQRYLKIYRIDLNDLSVYDLTISTDNLSVKKVVKQIIETAPSDIPPS